MRNHIQNLLRSSICVLLLFGGYCNGASVIPTEMVGVWKCKDSDYAHIHLRFSDGRIVGVYFNHQPDGTWRRVGSIQGRWNREGRKYILHVQRKLFANQESKHQTLSYSVGDQRRGRIVLFPDYDALAMVEVRIAGLPSTHSLSQSPETIVGPYVKYLSD
jgi:hypothetical protein